MKIRAGFVSNSSSCGFIIPLAWLTIYQLDKIKSMLEPQRGSEGLESWEKWGLNCKALYAEDDEWMIWITSKNNGRDCLCGSTDMDNGSLAKVFRDMDIPDDAVIFQHETHMEWGGEEIS